MPGTAEKTERIFPWRVAFSHGYLVSLLLPFVCNFKKVLFLPTFSLNPMPFPAGVLRGPLSEGFLRGETPLGQIKANFLSSHRPGSYGDSTMTVSFRRQEKSSPAGVLRGCNPIRLGFQRRKVPLYKSGTPHSAFCHVSR